MDKQQMRADAIAVFELTKGFTTQTTDTAMLTALQMAGYVMELTNPEPIQKNLICQHCGDWYGINIYHKCYKCNNLMEGFTDLSK